MNKKILRLALPNIISNISIPLLGMVDIAIAGRLETDLYIGAIALGCNIFNMVYWNFGFIRMSSSGFASQALGSRDLKEAMNILLRSIATGFCIGITILLLQGVIAKFSMGLINSSPETKEYVYSYFRICVWSAPAVLCTYALKGWFIGMQNAKIPMMLSIISNLINIGLSCMFVFGFDMQIEGIALGTMLSQILTLIITIFVWKTFYGKLLKYLDYRAVFVKKDIVKFFRVNADVFVRTFLLTFVTTFFTFVSSNMGDLTLSVNALLMQFFMLFSYFMDGFAYAGEALTGKFIGAKSREMFKKMLKLIFVWGLVISVASAIVYLIFPVQILSILTNKSHVIEAAKEYLFWAAIVPITGFSAFLWDGIYIGATASKYMRNAMIISSAVFFVSYCLTIGTLGNNGLWMSFIFYLTFRGVTQAYFAKKALFYRFE